MGAAVSLEALRAQIRVLEGAGRVQRARVPSGVPEVDALTRGLPRPGIVELCGAPGRGGTRLAAAMVAAAAGSARVAWVDAGRTLYPPALAALGVPLSRLLVVQPPADGAGADAWSAEQLLRSGCFALVAVSGARIPSKAVGLRWSQAAEHGCATALVLSEAPARDLPADLRLQLGQDEAGPALAVARDRDGGTGRRGPLPPWREEADPWQ